MKLIYCAGAYSGYLHEVANNIRKGRALALRLMELGFSVICPWNDWELAVLKMLPAEVWKAASMEQLRRSDALCIVPGWENSQGTKDEMEEANRLGIPIFFTVEDLCDWRDSL